MDKDKYHHIKDKTISRVNSILEDKYINDLINETTDMLDEITSGDDIPEQEQKVFPGAINIVMEPMKMTATLEILKPINSSNEITIGKVKELINELGDFFESRVDWALIHDIYSRVIDDDEIVPPEIIARGIKVEAYIPEHIILEEKLLSTYMPLITSHGRADYHKINSLVFVKKGEFIGKIIPSTPGVVGKKLDGSDIPFPKMIINNYVADQNIYIEDNKLFSKIDGTFKIVDNRLMVAPCLLIQSDIDYHTGDIVFTGDVEIGGSIRSGFSVTSGGDLLIKGAVEPTNISCNSNLVVNEGIFGSKTSLIDVKGNLNTKHIENVRLKSIGNLFVRNSIMTSHILTNGKITMDKNGTILGSIVYSLNGITCHNVGNELGVHTEIYLGIDYIVMEKLKEIQEVSTIITNEMEELQQEINIMETREERDKGKYLFLSLKNRLNSLNNHSRSLLKSLDKNDRSSLTVTGTIYPGSRINICHISIDIKEPLKNVTLFLNKDHGRIDWTGFTK
ncbi:DUF342 domain-containing protein [Thiospirochaeta perfilievii]|uniref:DUF342 domain-containing protein n=1 Tax=Thiospirochaeta perfilievii TaxID=252967 RepID=A0A5C1Q735_9SPIO|nr:FapA family protein [Thiospirochaeta perfilievii]QEN03883.1 DUF342 domain-containing protein [Thiospirochaeta perfilievii]